MNGHGQKGPQMAGDTRGSEYILVSRVCTSEQYSTILNWLQQYTLNVYPHTNTGVNTL